MKKVLLFVGLIILLVGCSANSSSDGDKSQDDDKANDKDKASEGLFYPESVNDSLDELGEDYDDLNAMIKEWDKDNDVADDDDWSKGLKDEVGSITGTLNVLEKLSAPDDLQKEKGQVDDAADELQTATKDVSEAINNADSDQLDKAKDAIDETMDKLQKIADSMD